MSSADCEIIRASGTIVAHNRCVVRAPHCTINGNDCVVLVDDCTVAGKNARISPHVRRVIVAPGGSCVGQALDEKCTYVQSDGTIVEPRASVWSEMSARTRRAGPTPVAPSAQPRAPAPAPSAIAVPVHSKAPTRAERDAHACIICEENVVDTIFDPCRHAAFCGPCARTALARTPHCPVCSVAVTSAAVVFLL